MELNDRSFFCRCPEGENVSGSKEEAAKNWSLEDEFTYKDADMLGMCHGRFNKCISRVLARYQTH